MLECVRVCLGVCYSVLECVRVCYTIRVRYSVLECVIVRVLATPPCQCCSQLCCRSDRRREVDCKMGRRRRSGRRQNRAERSSHSAHEVPTAVRRFFTALTLSFCPRRHQLQACAIVAVVYNVMPCWSYLV